MKQSDIEIGADYAVDVYGYRLGDRTYPLARALDKGIEVSSTRWGSGQTIKGGVEVRFLETVGTRATEGETRVVRTRDIKWTAEFERERRQEVAEKNAERRDREERFNRAVESLCSLTGLDLLHQRLRTGYPNRGVRLVLDLEDLERLVDFLAEDEEEL
jgi:hypothetical protein